MLRHFLLGKIHRCVVTRADISYVGSVTLDPLLIEAAGFLEHEKVDIYNVTSGERFATYVIPGERGGGEVGVNGAAAHLVSVGDLLIIASYGWLNEAEIAGHRPKAVFVDAKNQVTEICDRETNPPVRKINVARSANLQRRTPGNAQVEAQPVLNGQAAAGEGHDVTGLELHVDAAVLDR